MNIRDPDVRVLAGIATGLETEYIAIEDNRE